MKDDFGNILTDGVFVERINANNGWAVDDCNVPLLVTKAPENSNRKFDLFNSKTGKKEHFVRRREWQDMGASGVVLYKYKYISSARLAEMKRKDEEAKRKENETKQTSGNALSTPMRALQEVLKKIYERDD